MKRISQISALDVAAFCKEATDLMRGAESFEAAADLFAQQLLHDFEAIALARIFGTVEFEALPDRERAFAETTVADVALFPKTEVLTLFGTAGTKPQWNDRHRSAGHLAIPLLNRRTIEEAPMITRLLDDLHFSLKAEADDSRGLATRPFAGANAICHIPDAATTVDVLGRLVIPAADFVRENRIGTVVGVGGSYIVARMFVAILLFTTEYVAPETALYLKELSNTFKLVTTGLVRRKLLFGRSDVRALDALG